MGRRQFATSLTDRQSRSGSQQYSFLRKPTQSACVFPSLPG